MRSARTSRSAGRTLSSIGSETDENGAGPRQDSLRSSQTGSFLDREPVFDSGGSSDSESDYAPSKPARQPVSVVWQDITIVRLPPIAPEYFLVTVDPRMNTLLPLS